MPNTKISALTSLTGAGVAGAADVLPIVDTDVAQTKKITANELKTFMSDSPTLVTPALGTPASGNLANCTGLPVVGGGTGRASHTAYAVICGGTTSTAAQQSIAGLGIAGHVLTSNGPGALPTMQAPTGASAFAAGTKMVFYQATAPTGWTAEAINDHALRVVSSGSTGGTAGGADNFSALFGTSKSTAAHTLTEAQIPAHSHRQQADQASGTGLVGATYSIGGTGLDGFLNSTADGDTALFTQNTGGGGSHSHTLSNMNLRYADVIIATKD